MPHPTTIYNYESRISIDARSVFLSFISTRSSSVRQNALYYPSYSLMASSSVRRSEVHCASNSLMASSVQDFNKDAGMKGWTLATWDGIMSIAVIPFERRYFTILSRPCPQSPVTIGDDSECFPDCVKRSSTAPVAAEYCPSPAAGTGRLTQHLIERLPRRRQGVLPCRSSSHLEFSPGCLVRASLRSHHLS